MPDRLTTPEGVDKLTDDIAAKLAKLRMSTDKTPANGNGNGQRYSLFKDWNITPATALVLLSLVSAGGFWVWDVTAKVAKVEKLRSDFDEAKRASESERNDLKNRVAALEAQNFQYKEDRVKYREGIAGQLQIMKDDIGELKSKGGGSEYRIARLEEGQSAINARMDRAFDIYNKRFDDAKSAQADMSGDIKVLREQSQRIINWLEARDRGPSGPFAPNQTWRGFPASRAPFILRASPSPRSAVQIRVAEHLR
ncbi:hypothetical protein [Chenggangzhangella methanolivorans]|uniref:Uncharacterized protein n=1 Tax=Chenggangzhangella methanolivorans TaxID=1437009 RepID=A0A9E6RAC1_9HYPH|nr:hypothetical protein [Chenggangzhangella methanolivorans]QZN99562.1 hypothetical protein K6K41_23100 [Chenggangzhangella methanolivorans]